MDLRVPALAIGLILTHFGSVSDRLREHNPWHGFEARDPVLLIVRAQAVDTVRCKPWLDALLAEKSGAVPYSGTSSEAEWADDRDAAVDCHDFPCAVKLDRNETTQMATTPKPFRIRKYLDLVDARAQRYATTQDRKEYEFPGDPVDSWVYLKVSGFLSPVTQPARVDLYARRLDLAPGKMRAVHQILDRRAWLSNKLSEATVWIRDAYNDHYFDGWGEWGDVRCETSSHRVIVTQALLVELDLLKKTDFLSKMARGKMRDTVQENGNRYLDQWFERVKTRAFKNPN